jgi:hypothetical protein
MTDHIRERQLVTLLAAILLLLFAFPYVQGALAGDVLLNLLECAIVITVVAVVSTDWKHTAAAVLLGVLSLLSGWVPRSEEYPPIFFIGT